MQGSDWGEETLLTLQLGQLAKKGVKTRCNIKTHLNTLICFVWFFILWFFFSNKSPEDSLKIQLRSLKAYLLKNNLVPFIFVLCPLFYLWPEMIALTDVASDLGFSLINDSVRHWRREEKNEGDNPAVHHPLSKCREEIGYWPEGRLLHAKIFEDSVTERYYSPCTESLCSHKCTFFNSQAIIFFCEMQFQKWNVSHCVETVIL